MSTGVGLLYIWQQRSTYSQVQGLMDAEFRIWMSWIGIRCLGCYLQLVWREIHSHEWEYLNVYYSHFQSFSLAIEEIFSVKTAGSESIIIWSKKVNIYIVLKKYLKNFYTFKMILLVCWKYLKICFSIFLMNNLRQVSLAIHSVCLLRALFQYAHSSSWIIIINYSNSLSHSQGFGILRMKSNMIQEWFELVVNLREGYSWI